MAVYFNLAANFGTSEEDAKEFVDYFSNLITVQSL